MPPPFHQIFSSLQLIHDILIEPCGALECEDDGNVNTDTLRVILQDLQDDGATPFFGFTPRVVANDDALLETVKEFGLGHR